MFLVESTTTWFVLLKHLFCLLLSVIVDLLLVNHLPETKILEISLHQTTQSNTSSSSKNKYCVMLLVLVTIISMICCRILDKRKTPLPLLYDFVFDRLRAVRQDLVVQGYLEGYTGLKTVLVVKILEYCVRFYVYFQFRYLDLCALLCD